MDYNDNPGEINLTQQMMDDPVQCLDTVLDYFAMKSKPNSIKEAREGLQVKKGPNLSQATLQIILDKLMKDGNIFSKEVRFYSVGDFNLTVYKITFEGLIFHQQGGYKNKLFQENQSRNQERNNQNLQKQIGLFTRIIAIGTAIAAIYYIIEICKSFN